MKLSIYKKAFCYIFLLTIMSISFIQCNKNDLQLQNLNQPSTSVASQEAGIFGIASGIYYKAFGYYDLALGGDVGFTFLVLAQHEMLGDNIFCPYGNDGFRWTIGPKKYEFKDAGGATLKTVMNPLSAPDNVQSTALRNRNNLTSGDANGFLYEWLFMYKLNSASNEILFNNANATYSNDTKNILSAWAHWWKGVAYSRLGSLYISSIILDDSLPGATNNKYVKKETIISKANEHFNICLNYLNSVSDATKLDAIIPKLIPSELPQMDKASWIQNVNSYLARNIITSKYQSEVSATDWAKIKEYASKGLTATSQTFVLRTNTDATKSIISQDYQTLQTNSSLSVSNGTYFFTSPRFIQVFDTNTDVRYKNNFYQLDAPVVNIKKRGLNFGTNWTMSLGGKNETDYVYAKEKAGVWGKDDGYLACSYEENELMLAEANANLGDLATASTNVDNVKTYQKSGLPLTSTIAATLPLLNEEIRKERKRALIFRGLGFYDNRRFQISQPDKGLSNGWVFDADGTLSTTVKIDYAFLNYWDVPNNQLDALPASGDSDPVVSPN